MSQAGDRWRWLRVTEREQESATIVSLKLVAADGSALSEWQPGQYLTFRVPDGAGGVTTRSYSISSDPADRTHWRISVKREAHGTGSGHMHERMTVGQTIEAAGPSGQFVLRAESNRPVILLGGGVGITPLLAMAYDLARTGQRDATLIHACQNASVQPFRNELAAISARAPRLKVASCLAERDADLGSGGLQFDGFVTSAVLRSLLPIGDYEAYICGPSGFMQSMFDLLVDLGVREENIDYEFFGPAKRLTRSGIAATPAKTAPIPVPTAGDAGLLVRFAVSGRQALWDGTHRTLLDFAEAQGLQPAFSCRNGICMTCTCAIEGKVRYVEEPLDMPDAGHALLCCAVPDGPVTLEL